MKKSITECCKHRYFMFAMHKLLSWYTISVSKDQCTLNINIFFGTNCFFLCFMSSGNERKNVHVYSNFFFNPLLFSLFNNQCIHNELGFFNEMNTKHFYPS